MLFNQILDGIKYILENDVRTKDAIKDYYDFYPIAGTPTVPICVLGAGIDMTIEVAGLQNQHIFEGPITLWLLGRSYEKTPARFRAMTDELDTLQSNVYKVLNANENRKLNNTVLGSVISRIHFPMRVEEYIGWGITIDVRTKID